MEQQNNKISATFRNFQSRNYRLFFAGQSVSLIGTWIQQVALSWVIYSITKSAFMLGIVNFANQIPTALLTPIGGIVADKYNRLKIQIITQVLSMIQAFIIVLMITTKTINVWSVMILSVFLGIINAFDIPARQAFVIDIIEKEEDLGNAIALNSSMFNGARLIGPSVAGLLLSVYGEKMCFLINGFSFIAVIIALLFMKIEHQKIGYVNSNAIQELKEGFLYAFHLAPIRIIILLVGLISLVVIPHTILMPMFSEQVLHGGADTYGFLMGASGMGALFGAIFLAQRKNARGLSNFVLVFGMIVGVGLIAFSFTEIFWLAALLMAVVGFGTMVQIVSLNIILQTIVDEGKRGRTMGFYAMAFMGMTPIGSLLAGSLAGRIGVVYTIALSGVVCIISMFVFWKILPAFKEMIRPIYVKKNITR